MKNNNGFLKLINFGAEMKFLFAMYFMIFMTLNTLAMYFINGMREMSIITIWQIAGYALVLTLLHPIALTKLNRIVSTAIHGALVFIATIIFSLLCGLGFTETISIFIQFTITFVVIYAGISVGFIFYHKSEEAKLNKKLEEYKQNKE
jgi:hypothetical protein